jgi:hypothetical protein
MPRGWDINSDQRKKKKKGKKELKIFTTTGLQE